jgi:hypothetical protein
VNLTDTLGNVVPNEMVRISIDGVAQDVLTDSRGQASVSLNQLSVGSHDVVSVYETLKATSKITILSTLTTNDVVGNYLSTVCSATLLDTAGKSLSGRSVQFNINGTIFTGTTDLNGVVNVDVNLGAGSYKVTVTNPANNEQKQAKLTINKITPTMILNVTKQFNDVVITAELTPSTATGVVTFNVAGATYNQPIGNSKAVLQLNDMNRGNYIVTASYGGDNNLYQANANQVSFTVENPVNINVQNLTKTYGETDGISVLLTNAKGSPISGVTLNVALNGVSSTITTNTNGQAVIPVDLLPNNYVATISFIGNEKYEPATASAQVNINKIVTALASESLTYVYGDSANLVVSLKDIKGNPLFNEMLNIVLVGVQPMNPTDGSGQVILPLNLVPGTHVAQISYAGSDKYTNSNINVNINVKKADTAFAAKKATFKAKTKTKKYAVTLKAGSKPVAGIKVTLKVNGKTFKATTKANGKATFKIKKLTKKGKYKATISFAGNDYYNAATKTVKLTFKK